MANIKISDLPQAIVLDGTEQVPLVQGGTTKRANASLVRALTPISAHNVISNVTASSAIPVGNTLSDTIDAAIGNVQGDLLYRSNVGWQALAPGGSSGLVLTSIGPTGQNLAWTAGTPGPPGSGVGPWILKNSAYAAVSQDRIIADTGSASFTITLPVGSVGESVEIADPNGSWARNNLTVTAGTITLTPSWNPNDTNTLITLTNLNYTATSGGGTANVGTRCAASQSSGKFYFEVTVNAGTAGTIAIGLANSFWSENTFLGFDANGFGLFSNGFIGFNGGFALHSENYAVGDVVQVACDLTNNLFWWGKNGTGVWNTGGADPATGTNGVNIFVPGPLFPAVQFSANADKVTLATLAAQFSFAVPAGYSAWAAGNVTNSIPIANIAANLTCNVSNENIELVWVGGATGWQLYRIAP